MNSENSTSPFINCEIKISINGRTIVYLSSPSKSEIKLLLWILFKYVSIGLLALKGFLFYIAPKLSQIINHFGNPLL